MRNLLLILEQYSWETRYKQQALEQTSKLNCHWPISSTNFESLADGLVVANSWNDWTDSISSLLAPCCVYSNSLGLLSPFKCFFNCTSGMFSNSLHSAVYWGLKELWKGLHILRPPKWYILPLSFLPHHFLDIKIFFCKACIFAWIVPYPSLPPAEIISLHCASYCENKWEKRQKMSLQ